MSALDDLRQRFEESRPESSARSAPSAIYGGNNGVTVNPSGVVPTLTFRSQQPQAFQIEAGDNPFTAGPIFEIAMRIGAFPVKVRTIDPESGVRQETLNHPAYKLLRRPNPDFTRSLLISSTVADLLGGYQQRSFWIKERTRRTLPPFELWPLDSQIVAPIRGDRRLIAGYRISPPGQEPYDVGPSEIVDFRLLTSLGDKAATTSPLVALMKLARGGQAAIDAAADLFTYALFAGDWVDMKGATLSKQAFERMQTQLAQAQRDKYATPIMEDGAELRQKQGPSDEVITNAMTIAEQIVRRQLGLDSDDDTLFLKRVALPICDALEQELERSLMPDFSGEAFPEFAFRDALKGDPEVRAKVRQTNIQTGVWSIDDGRLDDDKPPLPNGQGDRHYIPLNLDAVETINDSSGDRRPKDTNGGLGGDQGKGTTPSAETGPQTIGKRAASRSRGDRWNTLREKRLARYSTALRRRLAGVMNDEAKAIDDLLTHPSERAATIEMGVPAPADLVAIVKRHDARVGAYLGDFMHQVGEKTWEDAQALISADQTEIDDLAERVLTRRAEIVAERFGLSRQDALISLLDDAHTNGIGGRALAENISQVYDSLKVHELDSISRTELAFAHEQSATLAWAQAGITEFDFIFGGGPCSTGVCEDAADQSPFRLGEDVGDVGASFEGADAAPLHPSCTCFTIPHVEEASA